MPPKTMAAPYTWCHTVCICPLRLAQCPGSDTVDPEKKYASVYTDEQSIYSNVISTYLRHRRKQMVGNLVIQCTGHEGRKPRSVRVVHRPFHLQNGPFIGQIRRKIFFAAGIFTDGWNMADLRINKKFVVHSLCCVSEWNVPVYLEIEGKIPTGDHFR